MARSERGNLKTYPKLHTEGEVPISSSGSNSRIFFNIDVCLIFSLVFLQRGALIVAFCFMQQWVLNPDFPYITIIMVWNNGIVAGGVEQGLQWLCSSTCCHDIGGEGGGENCLLGFSRSISCLQFLQFQPIFYNFYGCKKTIFYNFYNSRAIFTILQFPQKKMGKKKFPHFCVEKMQKCNHFFLAIFTIFTIPAHFLQFLRL